MAVITAQPVAAPPRARLADGLELLGEIHGSGYRDGAALVRRADGQMVQVGPLMYALLASLDGVRDGDAIAEAMSARLGRAVGPEHVGRLTEKAGRQGLLAGTEHQAPPRRNPLLALRWKVLVTNPVWTRRLTAPFTVLFRPWLMWPILGAFVAVCWFVLVHKGIASATAQAFHQPELLLLVFALGIASAGFHELGHASACRYGGGRPAGMGMGIYMVWPAFYTDVTDAYRLPRRDRLRVDLGGLYFNAVVAVATMGVWLATRTDALLLLIGLQLLQMVKQLSPVIRADGYHILADATGVPDLFAHIGPTMRRLVPFRGRREASPLHGRARALVTAWVLIVVPVLLSLTASAVLLFPRLATTAWESGRQIGAVAGHDFGDGHVLDGLAQCVRLLALVLPVLGTALVSQRILRGLHGKADAWSEGRPGRRAFVLATTILALTATAWAIWPSGQYQAIGAADRGTVGGMLRTVSAPQTVARPQAQAGVHVAPGRHLAVSLIPVGGATERHPAFFVIKGKDGQPDAVIVSRSSPDPVKASAASAAPPQGSASTTPTAAPQPATAGAAQTTTTQPVAATALPFKLPAPPRPGDSQALAVNTKDGSTKYVVAYSLVTVHDGAPVTNANSAYALASCRACTTVAVSFQIVLIVGTSKVIAPVDVAGALNANCPSCITTAIADQIVVTLKSEPPAELVKKLQADLQRLDALPGESPDQVAQDVADVQRAVDADLDASGLRANGTTTSTTSTAGSAPASTTPTETSTTPAETSTTPTETTTTDQTTAPTSTTPTSTTPTQTETQPQTTSTSTTPTTTSTTPTQTTTTSTTPTTTSTTPAP